MPLTPIFRQATTALVWAQASSSNQLPDDRNTPFITADAPRPPRSPTFTLSLASGTHKVSPPSQ